MPLVKTIWIAKESGWALWKITESIDDLKQLALPEVCPSDITSPNKKLEWLAGRALMKTVLETLGYEFKGIKKDEFGKPSLIGLKHQVSISHSYPYVAIQIDYHHTVGIDLEQPKSKLLKIASRILNPVELDDAGVDLVKHCVYWCAKEALYKIYGKRGLSFSENLKIKPFVLLKEGDLVGEVSNPVGSLRASLHYLVTNEFVLVYTNPIK